LNLGRTPPPAGSEPGLLEALARLAGRVTETLQMRLELASLELVDARNRLVLTLVASLAAVLLLGGALLALTAWLAVALWPTLGAAVLGWIALVYALSGAGVIWRLRAQLRGDPPLLADTLAELRRDAAFVRGQATVAAASPGRER
jgi:uncharacterized membrane protein YqjE